MDGFLWSVSKGQEKWASIKYERLSNFCYGCGRLGHTSSNCAEEVVMSEIKSRFPLYNPWLSGSRLRTNNKWFHIGEGNRQHNIQRQAHMKSWREVMRVATETEKIESSRGENSTSSSGHNKPMSSLTDSRTWPRDERDKSRNMK